MGPETTSKSGGGCWRTASSGRFGIRRGGAGGIEGGSSGVAKGNDPSPAIRCMKRSRFTG